MSKPHYRDVEHLTENMKINLSKEDRLLVSQLFMFGLGNWDGEGLLLLTPELLPKVPDGTTLTSISGNKLVKGRDYLDDDTRGGCLAYGITRDQWQEAFEWFDE